LRNGLLNRPFLVAMTLKMAEDRSNNIELPNYPQPAIGLPTSRD
jgi:hypothetical protein